MRHDPHKHEPTPGATVLLASGERLIILALVARTELGYVVRTVGNDPTSEIFRGGGDWLAVSDMFEYRGVPFSNPKDYAPDWGESSR